MGPFLLQCTGMHCPSPLNSFGPGPAVGPAVGPTAGPAAGPGRSTPRPHQGPRQGRGLGLGTATGGIGGAPASGPSRGPGAHGTHRTRVSLMQVEAGRGGVAARNLYGIQTMPSFGGSSDIFINVS